MPDPDDIMSISEVARFIGISTDWVRIVSDRGDLPAMRTTTGQRLFRRRDVEAYSNERKRNPPRTGPKTKAVKGVGQETNMKKKRRMKTKA